jgi:Fe-S-cluster containining protein
MDIGKTIKYLRKQIPLFKCKKGCTDCCGPVPFSQWEWDQVANQKAAVDLTCPYATKDGCEIYEQRPILCRLFGTVSKMKCPYGCGPNKMLSRKKEKEIMSKYMQIIDVTEEIL